MKIIRMLRTFDLNDSRRLIKGNSYEVEDESAAQLIAEGSADLPVSSEILSEEAKAEFVSEPDTVVSERLDAVSKPKRRGKK